MSDVTTIRVMFVCLGNICRSPMAEAVFAQQVAAAGLQKRIWVASSGTGSWHTGERPHPGTQAVLQRNQIPLRSDKVAQRLQPDDLKQYDYIIAMDGDNLDAIRELAAEPIPRLYRLLDFSAQRDTRDVPDPYYTGGFDYVYDLVRDGTAGLLARIREEHGL